MAGDGNRQSENANLFADTLISVFDHALRTLTGIHPAREPSPADGVARSEGNSLTPAEKRHAAGLMRVNHTGEICAQALYDGQAFTARDARTREMLRDAAIEESDHLAWCAERLQALDSRPSLLNPVFYAASFALGAATGLAGDRVSLGFVEATEDQVCAHLSEHLETLPAGDAKSRAVVARMHEDEARHGANAIDAGGELFPNSVKALMRLVSRVMTETTYRV